MTHGVCVLHPRVLLVFLLDAHTDHLTSATHANIRVGWLDFMSEFNTESHYCEIILICGPEILLLMMNMFVDT